MGCTSFSVTYGSQESQTGPLSTHHPLFTFSPRRMCFGSQSSQQPLIGHCVPAVLHQHPLCPLLLELQCLEMETSVLPEFPLHHLEACLANCSGHCSMPVPNLLLAVLTSICHKVALPSLHVPRPQEFSSLILVSGLWAQV